MMNTLVRACIGRIARRLDDLAHVVDAGARGGVHLHHVGMAVGQDGDAVGAHAAGIGGRAAGAVRAGAVQRAGDDAGGGGLADAAHAGQHEGVRDAAERRRRCAGCAPSPPGRSGRRSGSGGICGPARDRPARAPPAAPAPAGSRRTGRGRPAGAAAALLGWRVVSWNRPDMRGDLTGRAAAILCAGDSRTSLSRVRGAPNARQTCRQGNWVKAGKARGFTPGTPPGGAASWTSAKGIALGTLYFVGRTGGGISAGIASTLGSRQSPPICPLLFVQRNRWIAKAVPLPRGPGAWAAKSGPSAPQVGFRAKP